MEKKIRFGDLVREAGRPKTVTLWTRPEDDPDLSHAIKQNRVLTIIQEHGRTDHGIIGFKSQGGALYLVFPRALRRSPAARVIGINYQLIEEPAVPEKDRVKPAKASPLRAAGEALSSPGREKPEPMTAKPQPRLFVVKVRRTASQEDEFRVKALDQAEAEHQALQRARRKVFRPGKEMRVEVVNRGSLDFTGARK